MGNFNFMCRKKFLTSDTVHVVCTSWWRGGGGILRHGKFPSVCCQVCCEYTDDPNPGPRWCLWDLSLGSHWEDASERHIKTALNNEGTEKSFWELEVACCCCCFVVQSMMDTLSAGHLGGVPLDTSVRNAYIKLAFESSPVELSWLYWLTQETHPNCEWNHWLGRKFWVVEEWRKRGDH